MPQSGLSFNPRKKRVKKDDLSTDPRAVANRKWERGHTGLDLEILRIDKTAGVRRVRARKKLKDVADWAVSLGLKGSFVSTTPFQRLSAGGKDAKQRHI